MYVSGACIRQLGTGLSLPRIQFDHVQQQQSAEKDCCVSGLALKRQRGHDGHQQLAARARAAQNRPYLQHSPSCVPEGPADAIGEHLIGGLQQRGRPGPAQDTEAPAWRLADLCPSNGRSRADILSAAKEWLQWRAIEQRCDNACARAKDVGKRLKSRALGQKDIEEGLMATC